MNLTLEGDRILKDGEEIGRYDAGSNTLHVPKRIAPTVQKQITDFHHPAGGDSDSNKTRPSGLGA